MQSYPRPSDVQCVSVDHRGLTGDLGHGDGWCQKANQHDEMADQ
jgi:hypothetical protein